MVHGQIYYVSWVKDGCRQFAPDNLQPHGLDLEVLRSFFILQMNPHAVAEVAPGDRAEWTRATIYRQCRAAAPSPSGSPVSTGISSVSNSRFLRSILSPRSAALSTLKLPFSFLRLPWRKFEVNAPTRGAVEASSAKSHGETSAASSLAGLGATDEDGDAEEAVGLVDEELMGEEKLIPLEQRMVLARQLLEGSEAYNESFSSDEDWFDSARVASPLGFPAKTTLELGFPTNRTEREPADLHGSEGSDEFEDHGPASTLVPTVQSPHRQGGVVKSAVDSSVDSIQHHGPSPKSSPTTPAAASPSHAAGGARTQNTRQEAGSREGRTQRRLAGQEGAARKTGRPVLTVHTGGNAPPVVTDARFKMPSTTLKSLVTPQDPGEWTAEKEEFERSYPLHTPIQVRSTRTNEKFSVQLEDVLGAGGYGVVFSARDLRTGQGIALKVFRIRPDQRREESKEDVILRRRVQSELAIWEYVPRGIEPKQWSEMSHLVIPFDVIEVVTPCATPPMDQTRYASDWVVMDLFAGDVARMPKIMAADPSVKLEVTEQVFLANMYLHDMGLVHSDIKLPNYFISIDGRIFLGDHSLASPTGENVPCMWGTLRYLPPENMKCISDGRKRIMTTERKDVWALGVVLYKLWCNQQYPYEMGELWSKDLFVRTARAHVDELDLTLCDGHVTISILSLLRTMLTPNASRRPTLREIYKFHPVFKQRKSMILQKKTLVSILKEVDHKKGENPGAGGGAQAGSDIGSTEED
ncbi:rhoptry kinase family protein ROP21 [Toxoplasma gondii RUB]|uniref:Rhoptry kinase family protein ROP21 n=1 Tax=Toxoplasma gondii RUB TaxID=935652 RepID=A0A086M9K3_TOXGO|nr:rhoptry kinase family protein ROP21 [Toxoplasma gondii RUB]